MEELSDSEFEELVEIQRRMTQLSKQVREIASASGITSQQLLERMGGASIEDLQNLGRGAAFHGTVETLARFAWACGYDVFFEIRKRPPV